MRSLTPAETRAASGGLTAATLRGMLRPGHTTVIPAPADEDAPLTAASLPPEARAMTLRFGR